MIPDATSSTTPHTSVDVSLLKVSYRAIVLAVGIVAVLVSPHAPVPTLIAVVTTWSVCSLGFSIRRNEASMMLLALLTIALGIRNYAELDVASRFWGLTALGFSLLPLMVAPLRRTEVFPLAHLYGLVQGVYLFVAVFLAKTPTVYQATFSDEIRERGFRLQALFMATFAASTFALHRWLRRHTRPRSTPVGDSFPVVPRAYLVMAAAGASTIFISAAGLSSSVGLLLQLIRYAGYGAALLLVLAWLRNRRHRLHAVVVAALAALVTYVGIGSGLLYAGSATGILFLALFVAERRRVPWATLAVVVAALLVINVGKAEFRVRATSGLIEGSGTERSSQFVDVVASEIPAADLEAITQSAFRFSTSDLLGYFGTWLPERFPYYGYEAYLSIPRLLVPRVVMPDKGTFSPYNEIGRRYELIERTDDRTSVNTPMAAEAVLAGGTSTMVVVAALTAAFLTLVGHALRGRRPACRVTGALVALPAIGAVESGVISLVVVVPFALVLLPLMQWVSGDGAATNEPSRSPMRSPRRSHPN